MMVYKLFWLELILMMLDVHLTSADTTECGELAKRTILITSETEDALKLSTYERTAGTVVDVSCTTPEYEVIGARQLKCLPSGQWSAERPVCAPKDDLNKSPDRTAIIAGSVVGGCGMIVIVTISVLGVFVYQKRRKHLSTSFDSTSTSDIPLQKSRNEKETRFYGADNIGTNETEKIFKVWTAGREQKKLIAASSIVELKRKGAEKFKLAGKTRLVLESDGTEIDNNDGLFAFSDHVLLLLAEGDNWYMNDDNISRQTLRSSQFETIHDNGDGKIHIIIDKSMIDLQQATAERL